MPLDDAEMFPLLTEASRGLLTRLREHPAAPRWTHRCGERLTAEALARVRGYSGSLKANRISPPPGEPPWLGDFLDHCRRDVPFYRERLPSGASLEAMPTTLREDLRTGYWRFVPDSADLRDILTYWTSGTTGTMVMVPSCPEAPAKYLPVFEVALQALGIGIEGGNRMSIVHAMCQRSAYTYPSVMSYFGGAGLARLNLNPSEWRSPADRAAYLAEFTPELVTGDPVGLMELASLPLRDPPKALISSATALLPGTRSTLAAAFGCPVLNLYAMHEVGPIGIDHGEGLEIVSPDIHVEILAADGSACSPGVRGEITITSAFNPFMPLVRYRTGDHAALDLSAPAPRLVEFEGRASAIFRSASGRIFNSIDVTRILSDLPLPALSLIQRADGSVRMRTRCDEAMARKVQEKLRELFQGIGVEVERVPNELPWVGKVIQYRSEILFTGHRKGDQKPPPA